MKNNQTKTDSMVCSVCGKRPVSGSTRSHSMRRNKRTVFANIQKIGKHFICTRCLRTQSKKKNSLNGSLVETVKAIETTK